MEARRSRIIALGVLLGVLGAVIPIATMAYTSWVIAVRKDQDTLKVLASQVIQRASDTFKDAKGVLDAAEAAHLPPCSTEHIELMRRLTMNAPSVEEVGYFEDGHLKCTSWGITEGFFPKSRTEYTTPDGMEVAVRIEPTVSQGTRMTALHFGAHNVLVAPSRFVDILIDDSMSLALTTEQGVLINQLNAPAPQLVKELLGEPKRGMTDEVIYAVSRGDGLAAIAMEPRANITAKVRGEQIFYLPAGAIIAAFLVGTVIWLSRNRLSPLTELGIAVQKREFIVHYQPIVELKTGICIGAEALVRWRRPDGFLVRPDLFIPLAEESGLILAITDQVVDAIVTDLRKVLVEDRTLHIAVNLCAEDVASGRILTVIEEKLKHTGIRPEQIWLEATERGFIDIEAAKITLAEARQRGHSVAIDDFGTGYSSLQYLQGLPMDALKIDKSFVDTVGKDTATSSVTSHIIGMAKALGLFTVAEGIETEEQAEYLKAQGVDFGQGWLFSKALPVNEFVAYHRLTKKKYGASPEIIQAAAK
ncbi:MULTISPECIES: EAL domain-containing protein [unclassified Rhizobium]|uniref:EAL domain-containing protein n=1 Tax=unclassified Rhizobium TaxID=2613769 RepID=UPI002478775B|nr:MULTISPECIES: EAL domain-containing protein [unclassified Rhizobium]MDH7804112.1 sensor c-di-GMP phosphodiesterase-like protein [Rhizobium sp. AN70]